MSSPAHAPSNRHVVRARITYTVDTGVKPVSGTTDPDGRLRMREGVFAEHEVEIRDARPLAADLSLDREGFVFVRHETAMTDFHDADELRRVYYPEIEALIARLSGARRVVVFDHTLRTGDERERAARRLREPVKIAHNDYTEWSGPERVRDLLPDEAEDLLRHRFAVIQVWRPIARPVRSAPLAICDAASVAPGDLIAAERRHPNRVGEIYQLGYAPGHRWFWFPEMRREEALVFKCYDSARDGRARFTAHASFEAPGTPADAPPRESIEIRTLAFFAPDGADQSPASSTRT